MELVATLARWVPPRKSEVGMSLPEPADETTASLPALAGIDTVAGLHHVGGRSSLYSRVLRRFRDTRAGDFADAFEAARQAGDSTTARRLAHSLKSSAYTLGAAHLGDLSARLEEAVIKQTPDQADRLRQILAELDKVLKGLAILEDFEKSLIAEKTLTKDQPPPERGIVIRELLRLLEEQDTAAMDWLDRLNLVMAGSGHEPEVAEIAQAIAHYDFGHARTKLQRLAMALAAPRAAKAIERTT